MSDVNVESHVAEIKQMLSDMGMPHYYAIIYRQDTGEKEAHEQRASVWCLCKALNFGHQLSTLFEYVWRAGIKTHDYASVYSDLQKALFWLNEVNAAKPRNLWVGAKTSNNLLSKGPITLQLDQELLYNVTETVDIEKNPQARLHVEEFFKLKLLLLNSLLELPINHVKPRPSWASKKIDSISYSRFFLDAANLLHAMEFISPWRENTLMLDGPSNVVESIHRPIRVQFTVKHKVPAPPRNIVMPQDVKYFDIEKTGE